MADSTDNIIALPDRGRARKRQTECPDVLRAIVEQFDELGYRLQAFMPHSSWSAQRWMINTTPFRMRLTGTRKRLGDLARISPVGQEDAARWAFELNDARLEVERELHDIDACLQILQLAGTSHPDRARETEMFASRRSELLKALEKIRRLIVQRFPTVLTENLRPPKSRQRR
jgi:hypothetical protein